MQPFQASATVVLEPEVTQLMRRKSEKNVTSNKATAEYEDNM